MYLSIQHGQHIINAFQYTFVTKNMYIIYSTLVSIWPVYKPLFDLVSDQNILIFMCRFFYHFKVLMLLSLESNGVSDCDDESDEECENSSLCPVGSFPCGSQCISSMFYCDGIQVL